MSQNAQRADHGLSPLLYGAGGQRIQSLARVPMTRDEMALFIRIAPIMQRIGLSFYCVRCHGLGMPDGIRGDNDPQKKEQRISCGCAERIYIRP